MFICISDDGERTSTVAKTLDKAWQNYQDMYEDDFVFVEFYALGNPIPCEITVVRKQKVVAKVEK